MPLKKKRLDLILVMIRHAQVVHVWSVRLQEKQGEGERR